MSTCQSTITLLLWQWLALVAVALVAVLQSVDAGTARTMGGRQPAPECAGTLNAGHCVCGPGQSCHGRHCIDAHHAIGGNGALNRPTAVMHGYDPVKCPWCRCIWAHVSL